MKIRQLMSVYLEERVILFPFRLYVDTFLAKILDDLHEWQLLNKKITGKEKYFRYFVAKEFKSLQTEMDLLSKEMGMRVIVILEDKIPFDPLFGEFLEAENQVETSIKRGSKTNLTNLYISSGASPISTAGYYFKNVPVSGRNGDEIEFLHKILKKLKKS